jgi:hypothetical protein
MVASDVIAKSAEGPFRIVMASGATYDILHRDMMMVTQKYLDVGVYEGPRQTFPERVTTLYLPNVAELKSIPSCPPY